MKATNKALQNGKGWYQFLSAGSKYIELRLSPMSEKNWFQATWNGSILFQCRGKRDAVLQFNREIERAEKLIAGESKKVAE